MENYLNYKGISPLPGDFDEFWNEEIRKADKFIDGFNSSKQIMIIINILEK